MNIADILELYISEPKKNYTDETAEKMYEVYKNRASKEVIDYLTQFFENLKIEILGEYEGNIFELMNEGLLEGWCWQTTETAIIFMDDDSYIQRGNLKITSKQDYYHSWIVFNYKEKEYVFDPCLQIVCLKEIYDNTFKTEIKGQVDAKTVREFFIDYIENSPKKNFEDDTKTDLYKVLGIKPKNETVVSGGNNLNEPMYRNYAGYKAKIENGKVKKLTAHYYMNG